MSASLNATPDRFWSHCERVKGDFKRRRKENLYLQNVISKYFFSESSVTWMCKPLTFWLDIQTTANYLSVKRTVILILFSRIVNLNLHFSKNFETAFFWCVKKEITEYWNAQFSWFNAYPILVNTIYPPYSPLTVLFISPIYYTKRKKNMKKSFILNWPSSNDNGSALVHIHTYYIV